MNNYYTVVKGDTLAKIARTTGTTTSDLVKLNQIADPNRLAIGQRLALRKEVVTGVQPLFLDRNRDPIAGLEYLLEHAGKIIKAVTPENGLGRMVFTDAATDEVRIFIRRLDGTLKEIGRVVSGYGNKLVTVLSPSVKVEAETEKNPPLKPGEPSNAKPIKPTFDPKTKQPPTTDKKGFGVEEQPITTPDGWPLTEVKGDIPDLSFLDEYNGEVVTEADFEWAAKELGVEKAAIKAFAIVESGGGGYLTMKKRKVPKILYERHYFARLTGNRYSTRHPDISLPNRYYVDGVKYVAADTNYKNKRGIPLEINYYRPLNVKKDPKDVADKALSLDKLIEKKLVSPAIDKYAPSKNNYKRLVKAYQLDKEAALQSCSWGAFQIMGENWKDLKFPSVGEFVKSMSRSEKEQIKAFVLLLKKVKPGIVKALKSKDWETAAKLYNGTGYKEQKYDKLLEASYRQIKEGK